MTTIEILNAIPELDIRPRDCAFLVAIPTSRKEFLEDLAAGRDFAQTFAAQQNASTPEQAWQAYWRYADAAAYTMKCVRKRSVAVFGRATLAGFQNAVASFPVTTLVAHYRSARFRPADIVNPQAVPPCDALNELLDEGLAPAEPDSMSPGGRTELQFVWQERREKLEAALPGAFRGGASVEFAEGFQTIREIASGISPEFAGTLDLTVCQSVLLGGTIQRRCRKCLVLKNAENAEVDSRLAFYHQVIEVLTRKPQPFEDAAFAVRKALISRYGNR